MVAKFQNMRFFIVMHGSKSHPSSKRHYWTFNGFKEFPPFAAFPEASHASAAYLPNLLRRAFNPNSHAI
jgi:hypothetical protein